MKLTLSNTFIQLKSILKVNPRIRVKNISTSQWIVFQNESHTSESPSLEEEQFRVIEFVKKRLERTHRSNPLEKYFHQPREKIQPIDQDWGSVWPGIRTFHPATVPLTVRMGCPRKGQPNPDKWGNAELMKIPNFLHLTPPVIKRQCEAILKFCTPWPRGLETEELQNYHYPVAVKKSSYLQSSMSIRDLRARNASLKVSIDSLKLDSHAKDKMLRLVGDRFDPETNILTLESDRCPLSSQNMDYCFYLLTVLYNESLKVEPWESEKHELDDEYFDFKKSNSKKAVNRLEEKTGKSLSSEIVEEYNAAVTQIHNEGEDEKNLLDYRNSVEKLLNLV